MINQNINSLSFIIPCRNAESTIIRCLDSILAIDIDDKQIIIVCNNCIDNTEKIVEDYKFRYSQINIIIIYDNMIKNASMARNLGIAKSSHPWIIFVDSDDYFNSKLFNSIDLNTKEILESQMITNNYFLIKNNEINIRDHGMVGAYIQEKSEILEYLNNYCKIPYKYTLFVHCWAKIYRRSIITENNITFNEKLNQLEDVNFNLKYLFHCQKIYHTSIPLYFYDTDSNKNGLSINSGNEDESIRRIYLAIQPIKKILIIKFSRMVIKNLISQLITSIARIWMIRLSSNKSINIEESKYRIQKILHSKLYKVAEKRYSCREEDSRILNFVSKYLPHKIVIIHLFYKSNRRWNV